ncbi:MAG: DUF1571 domain-containing protein [Planctomycetaceae bacterium]|nr:DUF1571 domain-containing protein [Planctomycetaceae bacterium]
MIRPAARPSYPISCRRPNCLALVVALATVGFLYVNVDPITAGADPQGAADALESADFPPPPPLAIVGSSAGTSSRSGGAQGGDVITGRWALLMQIMLLEKGCASFGNVPDYTATLHKQERIGDTLGEVQVLKVKLRHEPFSVYMKWQTFDKGRELIYVEGENDGNMLIQPGGWKGRLTGTLSLDPNGRMAMSESRHPVSQIGLVRLAEKLMHYSNLILKRESGFHCEIRGDQQIHGRDCYVFVISYDSPEHNATYRRSVQYIDKELSLPVIVRNYTWSDTPGTETDDDQTLIESYSWSDIRVDQRLANGDFDQTNSGYRFQKR